METGKQGFVSVPALSSSVSAQREERMHDVQTTLPTVYLQTLGGLPLYPQTQTPASQDAVTLPLSISPLSSKQALPLLTFHIASGMHLQQQGQRSGTSSPASKPKSAGKHLCPHCGRDCLKPSVLEKHLRCHTGERPYPCTTCGVAFKTQSNLYKHKRTQAHARLSCESDKGSLSSQESMPGSGDTQSSSPSVGGQSEDSESFERDVSAPSVTPTTTSGPAQAPAPLGRIGTDTGWALHQAALVGLILAPVNGNQEKLSSIVQKMEPLPGVETAPVAKTQQSKQEEQRPAPSTPTRHLPLQRQQATFSKQWESRQSRGKSQNHDSTDSGFSESNDPHWTSSPGSTLHDHSMESLTESSMEHQEEPQPPETSTEPGAASSAAKSKVSMLEKRKLEERISKLISENDALVDDKCLENVRPRKTVLSKQGSIDLPMPYTYKDSFHFEMRTSKQTNMVSCWQSPDRRVKQTLYNSVPTQRSTSFDHMPLTRSSSLPFSIGSPGSERNGQPGHYQREGIVLSRRDSSGQLCPGDFVMRSVDQHAPHHRSLVRQSAVDCQPTAEGLPVTSSVEESYPSSLSSDGDSIDIVSDSSGGKCRRKKAQKFSYNKWYMYGGGTFTKLYNMDKGSDRGKAKKAGLCVEQGKVQGIQTRSTAGLTEPSSSEASTTSLRSTSDNIQTVCHPPCLPDNLASSSHSAEVHSSQVSTEPCLQRSALKDLSGLAHHCVVRQNSLPASDCTNGSRAETIEVKQEELNKQRSPLLYVSNLPSERKKQKTDDNSCVVVDSVASGEKEHNVLSRVVSQAGDNALSRPHQLLPSRCPTPKHTHTTERGDSGNVQVHGQDKRMDFSLCYLNQRPVRLKEHGSLPPLVNVGRPSSSVAAQPSISSSTTSSFLPKYQLKLPHPADQGAALEQSLTVPISEQRVTAVQSTEQSLATTTSSEHDLAFMKTLKQRPTAVSSTEQNLTAVQTSEQRLIAIPTSDLSLTAAPISASEQNQAAASIPISEKSHISAPKLAMNHSRTPTPNSYSEQAHTALSTSENTQSATFTSASGLSHTATPTLGQTCTASPTLTSEQRHSAMAASKQSDNATPSSVCVNLNTYFPKGESKSEGKIILLKGLSHAAAEETDYVKTGDIQIFLQIISEEQLPLMEAPLNPLESQTVTSLCQDVPQAAVRNAEAGIQSGSQRLKNDSKFPVCNLQGSYCTNIIQSSAGYTAPTTGTPGPSIPSDWDTVSQTEQHDQNPGKSAQMTSSHLKPITGYTKDCTKPAGQTDIVEDSRYLVFSDHKVDVSEAKPSQSQLGHVELQTPKQSDHGVPTRAKSSQGPNEELSKDILCFSLEACPQDKVTQQRIRAEMSDSVVAAHSQAAPPPLTSSTVVTESSTYIRSHTKGDQSEADSQSALVQVHTENKRQTLPGSDKRDCLERLSPCISAVRQEPQLLPMEISLLVQNRTAVSSQYKHCTDSSSSQSQILSAHQPHLSPQPQSSHLQDVPSCPDGIPSSSCTHHQCTAPSTAPCRTESGTAIESEGVGDTSTVSHFPLSSNRLFNCLCRKTPALPPAAILQRGAQTREESNVGPVSQSQPSTGKQDTVDSVKISLNQTELSRLGQASHLSDLGQQARHSTRSALKPCPGLQSQIQTSQVSVTMAHIPQTASEHTSLTSAPLTDTAVQQSREERHAQVVPAHCGSVEPFSQASLPAPRVSQQEPVSASLPGQHKLCLAAGISLSPSAAAEISSGSVLLHVSVQHKPLNQRVPCNAGKRRTKCGIHENEAVVNPSETSGGPHPVQPACSIHGCNMSKTSPAEAPQPLHSHIISIPDGRGPLLQDPAACSSSSAMILLTEKADAILRTSNTLCESSSSPSGRCPPGGAVSSLMRNQVWCDSSESQGHASTLWGQTQPASEGTTAAGQGGMVEGQIFLKEPDGEMPICATAEDNQGPKTGHQQSQSFGHSVVQNEQERQGTGWRPEEKESREAEKEEFRGREVPERGGMEETEARGMEKPDSGDPHTSPLSVPTNRTTTGDVNKRLAGDETYSHSSSGVSLHTPQGPGGSETRTLHTLQVNAQSETSTLRSLQPPTQSKTSVVHTVNIHETSALHTLQVHTQHETNSLHTLQPPTQSESGSLHSHQASAHRVNRGQGIHQSQLSGHYQSVTSCSTEWGVHKPVLPQPDVQWSPTPESYPPSVNAGELDRGVGMETQATSYGVRDSAAHPLQSRSTPSLESGVHHEGLTATALTSTWNTDWRPPQTVNCSIPVRSEQSGTLHTVSATTHTHPFLSHTSSTRCSVSLSVKSSEVPLRVGQNSLEEADTSSSDDEGRLVIEL